MELENFFDEKPQIISTEEKIVIGIIAVILLITLNASLTFFFSFIIIGIMIISEHIYSKIMVKDRKTNRYIIYWIIAFWFAIIDSISTYFAVHILKIGEELNPFVNFLWSKNFLFGELTRLSLLGFSFAVSIYYLKSEKKVTRNLGRTLVILQLILFGFVIISNISQLIIYFLI